MYEERLKDLSGSNLNILIPGRVVIGKMEVLLTGEETMSRVGFRGKLSGCRKQTGRNLHCETK